MPVVALETNVKVADSKALAQELSKLASKQLGKPEELVLVKYDYNEALSWGGTFDPAFLLTITSLGSFSPDKNVAFSDVFTNFLVEKLGVSNKRGYLAFIDPVASNIGYSNSTVAKLFH